MCSFYTRLFKIKDPTTGQPVFSQLQVTLVCEQCKEDGLAAQCKHMLHLVPQWQSSARHERLKEVMADRPDLIQSELAVYIMRTSLRPCPCSLILYYCCRGWLSTHCSSAFAPPILMPCCP